jgi:hypothetical protein
MGLGSSLILALGNALFPQLIPNRKPDLGSIPSMSDPHVGMSDL